MTPTKYTYAGFEFTKGERYIIEQAKSAMRDRALRLRDRAQVMTQAQALDFLTVELGGEHTREQFYVVSVDCAGRVVSIDCLGLGTVSSVGAPVREIMRTALVNNASGIILCHNHPSGDTTPSKEDIQLTAQVAAIGAVLDIDLLDHVIIAAGQARSMSPDMARLRKGARP